MAGFAQTTINKLNQFYTQWVPRIPAEVNPRNVLIFCVLAFALHWFDHGGIGLDALCRTYA